MTGRRFHDFAGVEVEHLVGLDLLERGDPSPGLVQMCVILENGDRVLGQLRTGDARQIAGHLLDAAARAEYEGDLCIASKAEGVTDEALGAVMRMVRRGEIRRCTEVTE